MLNIYKVVMSVFCQTSSALQYANEYSRQSTANRVAESKRDWLVIGLAAWISRRFYLRPNKPQFEGDQVKPNYLRLKCLLSSGNTPKYQLKLTRTSFYHPLLRKRAICGDTCIYIEYCNGTAFTRLAQAQPYIYRLPALV